MLDGGGDRRLLALGDLVAQLAERLLGLVDHLVAGVAGVHLFLARLILGGVLLSLADGLVDVLLGEVGGSGDGDLLLGAGAHVLGGDVHDAVGVDIKGDLDLRHATGRGRDAGELEAAEGLVVGSHLTLALEHVDFHGGLAVGGGGEDLALLGGDGGVAVNQTGEHAAHGLNAQGQRRDIQQQQTLDVAAEHAALDGSAHSHALVGVDALEAFLAGHLLDGLLHGGDSRGAAHQQHLGDVIGGEAGVGHGLAHRLHGGVHQMRGELIELGAGQGDVQVLGAGGVGGDIGQVDVGGGHAGELNLGLLSSLFETLHSHLVAAQVDALALLELGNQVVDDALVKVVAAQMGVAGRGQNLDDAVADVQDGHIEGAAAQVIDHDLLLGFLVHAVGESRGGGLVDDTLDFQTGDLAGVLGGLTLGVVEVSGNGDDSLVDGAAQIRFGVSLELLEDHGRNFLRRVLLAVDVHLIIGAHVTLDGRDGALVVGHSLALCHLADHALAGLGECHHGRGGAVSFCVGDDHGLAALHHCHAAIGCTKVDTDNLAHNKYPPDWIYEKMK